MASELKLTFHSGVETVTGANFLLETPETKILIDCGLVQGISDADRRNAEAFPYDPKTIDILFITHAHMDHIGRVPKLVRDGFAGEIYSTAMTREISALMLDDAFRIMEMNGNERMYERVDIQKAFSLWKDLPYRENRKIADVEVYLKDAGHILGSAMYEITSQGKRIVFTGDLGNSPSPLLPQTEEISDADYLIMESVYGDRNHESREESRRKFADVIRKTLSRRGAVVIPSFSLERTQEILYELNELVEGNKIPLVPVFLDSPLASRVTDIYERTSKHYNSAVKKDIASGDNIFSFPKLKETIHSFDSKKIKRTPNPKIIIAGSGMSTGGRVLSHETEYLPDPASTLLLVGYQSIGTLGREIQDGAKEVLIQGTKVPVRARVELIAGYSSHKDSDHLIEFVSKSAKTLKKVFVVMGEPKSSMYLAQRLRDYVGVQALCPEKGKTYFLED